MGLKKGLWFYSSIIIGILLVTACSPAIATSPDNSAPPVGQQSAPTEAATIAGSSSNSVDACTLLPKEAVSKVLGVPVLSADSSGLGGVCSYKTTNLKIDFTIGGHTGGAKAMATTLANLGDLALVVPGLGDQAFYNTNSANALFLLKGDAEYLFGISELNYQPLDPAFIQATEKSLAEQLLSTLP
jgi:hypothetical protein